MNLDWSTLLLEIVNFLILVWILSRFLYKPILNVLAARRAGVEKVHAEAAEMHREAERLKQEYEARAAAWPKEREQAETALREELRAERTRQMEALRNALDEERKKHEVLEERRLHEQAALAEQTAIDHGAAFASRLLSRVASPELETSLIDLFVDELVRLPQERRDALRRALDEAGGPVRIGSAHPLIPAQRARLAKGLEQALGTKVVCEFDERPELMAGVRAGIGPWMLQADLQSELRLFRESAEGKD